LFGRKRIKELESRLVSLQERLKKEEKRNGKIEREIEDVKRKVPNLKLLWKAPEPEIKKMSDGFSNAEPSVSNTANIKRFTDNFAVVLDHSTGVKRVSIDEKLFSRFNYSGTLYIVVSDSGVFVSDSHLYGGVSVSSHVVRGRRNFYLSRKTSLDDLETGYYPVKLVKGGLVIDITRQIDPETGKIFEKAIA